MLSPVQVTPSSIFSMPVDGSFPKGWCYFMLSRQAPVKFSRCGMLRPNIHTSSKPQLAVTGFDKELPSLAPREVCFALLLNAIFTGGSYRMPTMRHSIHECTACGDWKRGTSWYISPRGAIMESSLKRVEVGETGSSCYTRWVEVVVRTTDHCYLARRCT